MNLSARHLNFSLLESGLIDKVYAFIAPKIIGGRNSLTSVEGNGFENLNEALTLKNIAIEQIDENLIIQIKTLFQISGIDFMDDEIKRIANAATRYKKDSNYLMQIIPAFNERLNNTNLDPIEDKVGYFCRMIEHGIGSSAGPKQNKKNKDTNKFNNFSQRNYDMDELERKLIGY